jgi:hypothetical protein
MTDSPDKACKPVTAALLALLALALLAGCKSEPPITGPRTGYLHFKYGSVTFVEWTQTGQKLEGQISALNSKPDGKIGRTVFFFKGTLDGEMVRLTLSESSSGDRSQLSGKTITGALVRDTLTLPPVNEADGPESVEYRRATPLEFANATAYLQEPPKETKTAK